MTGLKSQRERGADPALPSIENMTERNAALLELIKQCHEKDLRSYQYAQDQFDLYTQGQISTQCPCCGKNIVIPRFQRVTTTFPLHSTCESNENGNENGNDNVYTSHMKCKHIQSMSTRMQELYQSQQMNLDEQEEQNNDSTEEDL